MRLILLHTCAAEASVALADTSMRDPIVAVSMMPGKTASESLIAVVRKTMAQAKWNLADLEAIAVVTGPGSFTGVRIGLSAAKGLGEAIGVPMVAVSRLAMLAARPEILTGRVCCLLDAGRGEFYCGQYVDGEERSEALLSREDALAAAREANAVVVCEEAVYGALVAAVPIRMVAEPNAADALPLARARLEARLFDDPVMLDARYLRRTDAEIFAHSSRKLAG